jgi:TetR/AcrR family transcriptional repressor of nem operon
MESKLKISTRDKILEVGTKIIHHKGYNHTGIQEILKAAGVAKGSFYNFFKSKEEFGLQVIDYFSSYFSHIAKEILEDRSVPPLERIKLILQWFMEYFKSTNFTRGCPIGNLSQEMGDLSPAFREKLSSAIEQMVAGYANVLAEAQAAGEISEKLDVRETANFIVSSWHGALVHMKVVQSVEPLKNHSKFIFDIILNRPV